MTVLYVIFCYIILFILDIIILNKNKDKKQLGVYVFIICLCLYLSISLVKGVKFPSIASTIENLFSKIIK